MMETHSAGKEQKRKGKPVVYTICPRTPLHQKLGSPCIHV